MTPKERPSLLRRLWDHELTVRDVVIVSIAVWSLWQMISAYCSVFKALWEAKS